MRDSETWRKAVVRQLRPQWPQNAPVPPSTACEVELGLTLVSELLPGEPARALPTLLSGYAPALPQARNWGEREQQILATGRHLLTPWKNAQTWEAMLDRYGQLPDRLRLYTLDEAKAIQAHPEILAVAPDRLTRYQEILGRALPYRRDQLPWAKAGVYRFRDRDRLASVTIPEDLAALPDMQTLPAHDCKAARPRKPICVSRKELLETAAWMDAQRVPQGEAARWVRDLEKVSLNLFDPTGTALHKSEQLRIESVLHLVGMVGAGKSTLMDVLAVWAARNGRQVTLVVGDVISALDRAQLFVQLGLTAAPILGQSERARHINRLHRAEAARYPDRLLAPTHVGFRWLSTACPLNGLRDADHPLPIGAQPCRGLQPVRAEDEASDRVSKAARKCACPIYPVCPTHQAARDLPTAAIWVATPASLVYTRVDQMINTERIRFLELAYRRSDLIIVDEADQVQAQWDSMFIPSENLTAPGTEVWLNALWSRVTRQLIDSGRAQVAQETVGAWCEAHEIAQAAVTRLYRLLLTRHDLRDWLGRGYFTGWSLCTRLAAAIVGLPESASTADRKANTRYEKLMEQFRAYLNDPLGTRTGTSPLVSLARQALTVPDRAQIQAGIVAWIPAGEQSLLDTEETARIAERLHFALLVEILDDRLNFVLQRWKAVEAALQLQDAGALMFDRPPEDWTSLLPETPMGNLLGFQYLPSLDNPQAPGTLRFFRCSGVGRWLLLHLHDLLAAEGVPGPAVLLMSGTSWAGTAPGYHVQVPVGGVLAPPPEEIAEVAKTQFHFLPFHDDKGQPITVSGRRDVDRVGALQALLSRLALGGALGGLSRLERERNSLDPKRQRILLLVGSYAEASLARGHLEDLRPEWRGQIRNLVPDDAEAEAEGAHAERTLLRGSVHRFAKTSAWILIAPLRAVERGHNILNEANQAAIGAVFFLVRPHPRPDDLDYAVHQINHWAIEHAPDLGQSPEEDETLVGPPSAVALGRRFRNRAAGYWRHLLERPLIYSSLYANERKAFAWDALVVIWQVIGRLIRGGVAAQVYFCDAAFAPRTAAGEPIAETVGTSLLLGMREVLQPYFVARSKHPILARDRAVAQALFLPLFRALEGMEIGNQKKPRK